MGRRGVRRPRRASTPARSCSAPSARAAGRVRRLRRHGEHGGPAAVARRARRGAGRRANAPAGRAAASMGRAARARAEGQGRARRRGRGHRASRAARRHGLEGVRRRWSGATASWRSRRAAARAASRRRGRDPVRHRRAGDRQEPAARRAARARSTAAAPGRGRAVWLEGRCVSYGESLPYWPFRDLLREWLGAGVDEPELRVRVALRRARRARSSATRADEIYPYLGAMLGLALEPDAAAARRRAVAGGAPVPDVRGRRRLLERLAADGPVVVAIEDLHWADPTSVQLARAAARPHRARGRAARDRAARRSATTRRGRCKERRRASCPHRTRELDARGALGRRRARAAPRPGRRGHAPAPSSRPRPRPRRGQPVLPRGAGRLAGRRRAPSYASDGHGWRFDHDVAVEVPQTVEKVILARIDRLTPPCHDVLTAASVLGRRFGLPLLEGVAGANGDAARARSRELQRLDLVREGRRWPQPEYRFKHALIQEAAYRTLLAEQRTALHRRAAEWLEDRYAGTRGRGGRPARAPLAAPRTTRTRPSPTSRGPATRRARSTRSTRRSGTTATLLPLLERARRARRRWRWCCSSWRSPCTRRCASPRRTTTYQRAFELWTPPSAPAEPPTRDATRRDELPARTTPTRSPRSRGPTSSSACSCSTGWSRPGPSARSCPSLAERWEISDDGLRYVFHLREGLRWSDGAPLTAHDVEFGIKRVLDPAAPGLVGGDLLRARERPGLLPAAATRTRTAIGVRALDDRTVEFRLAAPAPYFMSVMNRPDGGPQPRHAIERDGADWTEPGDARS